MLFDFFVKNIAYVHIGAPRIAARTFTPQRAAMQRSASKRKGVQRRNQAIRQGQRTTPADGGRLWCLCRTPGGGRAAAPPPVT